tara:strand:+ start:2178 stop:2768 length:591 start_codon:yes stop_codon:yes gene_type:complete
LKILVACEFSGTVRDAFLKKGHDAISCDILEGEGDGPHYQGDIRDILYNGWDLIIAHPPCTYLANSGVSWLHKDETRWPKLDEAAKFFNLFLNLPNQKICVENPIMHKYAKERIGNRNQSQVIQPWMFGHLEQKATCLWLRGLPLLKETKNVKEDMLALTSAERQKLHWLPPSPNRWKLRSKTYQGIADAMADQWG